MFLGIWGRFFEVFFSSIFSSTLFYSAGSSIGCIHCSVVASKSRKGSGRVEREVEESKGKWKSRKGN
jgi:ribosomal protein S27E